MSFSLFIEILNSLWFRIHLQRPLKALKTTASNSNRLGGKSSHLCQVVISLTSIVENS